TTVKATAGDAYTVAGVGPYAALGLAVLNDNLTLPPRNMVRVRVMQASAKAKTVQVKALNGPTISAAVDFAKTTPYATVQSGRWSRGTPVLAGRWAADGGRRDRRGVRPRRGRFPPIAGAGPPTEAAAPRRAGANPRRDGAGSRRHGANPRRDGAGRPDDGAGPVAFPRAASVIPGRRYRTAADHLVRLLAVGGLVLTVAAATTASWTIWDHSGNGAEPQ